MDDTIVINGEFCDPNQVFVAYDPENSDQRCQPLVSLLKPLDQDRIIGKVTFDEMHRNRLALDGIVRKISETPGYCAELRFGRSVEEVEPESLEYREDRLVRKEELLCADTLKIHTFVGLGLIVGAFLMIAISALINKPLLFSLGLITLAADVSYVLISTHQYNRCLQRAQE